MTALPDLDYHVTELFQHTFQNSHAHRELLSLLTIITLPIRKNEVCTWATRRAELGDSNHTTVVIAIRTEHLQPPHHSHHFHHRRHVFPGRQEGRFP